MEEDKFKKLIQHIDLEEPGESFTDNIMKMVEANEEWSPAPALLAAVKNELLVTPSYEFTNKVMSNIQPKESEILAPLITKKILLIIAGIIILVLLLVLNNFHSGLNRLQNNSYLSQVNLNLSGTTMGIIKIATTVLPYLIPLSILLLIDYFFRAGQVHKTS